LIRALSFAQLTRPASTSAITLFNAWYEGFGVQSLKKTPDCQPWRLD
jgi:hypothetical protein